LEVTKKLTGRDWFDSDVFEFTLEPAGTETEDAVTAGNVIMPKDLTIEMTKADGGKAAFGDITFKVPGVYIFSVKEKSGTIDNLAYDGHTTEVIATVEDNQKGELVVVATSYIGEMTFENVYTPDEINVTIGDDVDGVKELKGRTLADGEFSFTISKADSSPADTPMPAVTSVTNKDGKISFGAVTYTKAGTYTYLIKEDAGTLPGIQYDDGIVTAVVEVTYNPATGKLAADVSYSKAGGNGGDGFVFVNEYNAAPTDPVDFSVKKKVTPTGGNTFDMSGADFEFEVEPSAGNPASDPVA
ncbi:MAG: hypothetical protein IKI99_02070, partial [Firmicutes bacterium]|nr:hypothetical protein [Bacillota bacterium]